MYFDTAPVMTLRIDRLISLFDLNEQDGRDGGKHGVKLNRVLFMNHFVVQQTDPDVYFHIFEVQDKLCQYPESNIVQMLVVVAYITKHCRHSHD